MLPNSKSIYCQTYIVATKEKLYLVLTQSVDPAQSASLSTAAQSFRFATPPELPTPIVGHRRLKIALIAGAVVGGLAALVGVGLYLRKKE